MFELHNITKSYWTPRGRRYVFRNLNLSIPPNRNIGLIGRNGSGKSTLMRLLGGVDKPDSGRVVTDKNISWPVGLGGSFQGSMSGRDNVKFVCRVYGAVGDVMREKVLYVQEFADIGRWFDEPVRSYSSGMRARLAFGLSMAFDFDYYLIDEVMAVGDARFKQKSADVFKERLQNSKIILVSHNMRRIQKMCDIVVHLDRGRATIYENVVEGIAAYHAAGGVDGKRAAAIDAEDDELEAVGGTEPRAGASSGVAQEAAEADDAAALERRRARVARRTARAARQAAGGGK